MAGENFLVSSLPDYVVNNRQVLVKDIVFGTPSISRLVPQTGIKTSAAINYISADPVLQNGKGCGFTPENTTELTQRVIETVLLKVNEEFCPDTLLGKWAEYLVRIPETQRDELPFEAYVLQVLSNAIKNKIEKLIWQGDTASADADLAFLNGIATLASTEADTEKVQLDAQDTMWNNVLKVIAKLPNDVIRRGDVRIYMGPEHFLALTLELVEKNFYHYPGPQNAAPEEIVFPGTNFRVISVAGLADSKDIIATNGDNLYYGTDVEDADQMFRVFFDDKSETIGIAVRWNMGVQIAFPNRVVFGTFAELGGGE